MLDLTYATPSNFGRYTLQSELDTNERTQNQQKITSNNIPSLMSLSVTPPLMTTDIEEKSTTPTSLIKENIEPVPLPQHVPGPIQRPNKLLCEQMTPPPGFFTETAKSPNTPDVLVQINHLLDHQNSITRVASTSNVSNSTDLSTPNVPWTPFSGNEWPMKYDSSWPLSALQNSNTRSTTQMQNPFVLRQLSKDETAVWPTALGTATPRSTPLSTRTQQGNEWNDLFAPTTPSTTDSVKSSPSTWPKFLPVSNSSSVDNLTENKQENEQNNTFWNQITPSNSTTSWWPKPSSDDTTDKKDQSRWDFAR